MSTGTSGSAPRRRASDWREHVRAAALCAAAVFACVLLGNLLFTPAGAEFATLWAGNAAVVALVLKSPRRLFPALLVGAGVADVAAQMVSGESVLTAPVLSAANLVEVCVCLGLLLRIGGPSFDLARPRHMAALGLAAAVAPVVSGVVAGLGLFAVEGLPPLQTGLGWWPADALGLMALTPAFLLLSPRKIRRLWRAELRGGTALVVVLILAVLALAFGQSRYPMLFLVPGVLVFAAFHRGLTAAAFGVLATALVSGAAATFGTGGLAGLLRDAALSGTERAALQQLFLAAMVVSTLPVAVALAHRGRLERSLRSARGASERSERRYRLMAENATDVIVRLDLPGNAMFVSPACARVIGYAPEELVGRQMREVLHPDDAPRVNAAFRAMVAERLVHAPAAIEYRIRHKSGHWVWLEANPTLVWDAAGRAVEFVDVVRDISAHKAAEAALAEARRQADAAAAAKSDFLATMSHELRTPLTSIIGFSGLLAGSDRLGPEEGRHVERIRVASDALLSVINDVLDYSKLEAGGVELEPRAFCLEAMVRETLGLVAQQAEAKGLSLQAEFDPAAVGAGLVGDGPRLRQVLLNFLSNAVKFTGQGGVTVRVGLAPAPDGRELLRVAVADTGIGVAPDKLNRLFERFMQAEGSISRRFGGTGLGLSISRRLIEMMDGEVGVDSQLGRGSTFWFAVPLPRAAEVTAEVEVDAAPLSAGRVLMVDDNEANRELVSAVLGALGLEVDTAADGAQAVEAVMARDYDLVLMDVHMPVMDGLEATRTIRQLGPRYAALPIVALTADVRPEHVARCREAGMHDHVGKPIVPARLYEALGRWMGQEDAAA